MPSNCKRKSRAGLFNNLVYMYWSLSSWHGCINYWGSFSYTNMCSSVEVTTISPLFFLVCVDLSSSHFIFVMWPLGLNLVGQGLGCKIFELICFVLLLIWHSCCGLLHLVVWLSQEKYLKEMFFWGEGNFFYAFSSVMWKGIRCLVV